MPPLPTPFFVDDARPFARREQGMSLDIIHPDDIPRGKVPFLKNEDRSLKTQDIDRAVPKYRHLDYLNKEDHSVGCVDPQHPGGRARTYYAPMDRRPRDLSLTTADIELAQSKSHDRKGNRHTDPLCPSYELASCHVRPVTPPRWNGRHTHDLSDIEGTSSKARILERNYCRNPNDSSDVEYASANYHEREGRRRTAGKAPRADRALDVRDITQARKPGAERCTNPLDPVYNVSTTRATSVIAKYTEEEAAGLSDPPPVEDRLHGEVHGSRPRRLTWDNGEPQFNLMREDIAGTVPQRWIGSVPFNIYDTAEAKPVLERHDPHDIPGAQVGSLKKGICGPRAGKTNPLNPRYTMLDGDRRTEPVPYIDAERGAQRPNSVTHPLQQTRGQASSLPGLHVGDVPPAGRSSRRGQLSRDRSETQLRQGGTALADSGSYSRVSSAAGTPSQPRQRFFDQATQRLPSGGGRSGRGRGGGSGAGTPLPQGCFEQAAFGTADDFA